MSVTSQDDEDILDPGHLILESSCQSVLERDTEPLWFLMAKEHQFTLTFLFLRKRNKMPLRA